MNEQERRTEIEGLLSMCPFEWRRAYDEIIKFKRQMNLIDEAYEEMREWGTYKEEQNQTMVDTIEEDKSIMLELKRKLDHHREEYLKLVHAAGAVTFTLLQMLKFIVGDKLIIIEGEEDISSSTSHHSDILKRIEKLWKE